MAGFADHAEQWVTYAQNQSGEAQAGGEYALVCAAIAQTQAILAVAEAIGELTRVLGNGYWEADAHR